ncbi:hypothetical protein [Nonomuraea pusilla]|uniref:Uncharacterized protein n=1 Tax=Nonomuraea pusilla TaxID=46177 RepID=A0A1H7IQ34_9ACTN|nr:hypothetical protein [Nonomuraea pusilla]SEK64518.1 hypothetical protein SAMN05660976_00893 [Nonomuraea pusilla]
MSTLAERLRAGVRHGSRAEIAAVELLIADTESGWFYHDEGDFVYYCVSDDRDNDTASIDWDEARRFFENADPDYEIANKIAILDFAIALIEDRFRLGFLSDQQRRLFATAAANATGNGG